MNIHEYQAKELLAEFGLNIPQGKLAYTATEAEWAARRLNCGKDGKVAVVKAQVHSGGRGKAGGVKLAKTPEEAFQIVKEFSKPGHVYAVKAQIHAGARGKGRRRVAPRRGRLGRPGRADRQDGHRLLQHASRRERRQPPRARQRLCDGSR